MVVVACPGVSGGCDSFVNSVELYGGGSGRLAIPVRSRLTISAATEKPCETAKLLRVPLVLRFAHVGEMWRVVGLGSLFFGLSGLVCCVI